MLDDDKILKVKYSDCEDKQNKPVKIDLRAGEMFEIDNSSKVPAGIFNSGEIFPKHIYVPAKFIRLPNFDLEGLSEGEILYKMEHDGNLRNAKVFTLNPNRSYLIKTANKIKIRNKNEIYLSKSTLIKSGIAVVSAFCDLEDETHLVFLVKNLTNGEYLIEKNASFIQLLDFENSCND